MLTGPEGFSQCVFRWVIRRGYEIIALPGGPLPLLLASSSPRACPTMVRQTNFVSWAQVQEGVARKAADPKWRATAVRTSSLTLMFCFFAAVRISDNKLGARPNRMDLVNFAIPFLPSIPNLYHTVASLVRGGYLPTMPGSNARRVSYCNFHGVLPG